MPTILPISDFFNITDYATPAVYENAAGTRKDIEVIYEKSNINDQFGSVQASVDVPIAFCKSSDVEDFSKGGKLILGALIENDAGSGYLVDQIGRLIIAEGIATDYIVDIKDDHHGITMLTLSADPIQ
jgi:hypothetical protein